MKKHIHILGISGTFMGGVACLAHAKGYKVTGQDQHMYPPMSTQLEQLGIQVEEGYGDAFLKTNTPDQIIVGNALSRGIPVIETLLNRHLPYQSGPAWIKENILKNRWVIAVAGTHGKTTTASMVAWILEFAGFNPGFLIGGVPSNFDFSARLGSEPYFVIEADEYDTAFFDKRSKFLHYSPQTCIVNNLEYDHADIFDNMNDIYKQFHGLMRTLPSQGLLVIPQSDHGVNELLTWGSWTPHQTFGAGGDWQAIKAQSNSSAFEVYYRQKKIGRVEWDLMGDHNISNALAAIGACMHAGIRAELAIEALRLFKSVKRRMEVRGVVNDITVYDDFAHHPTAIATTLQGLRDKVQHQKIWAIVEFRSNTMKKGTHKDTLGAALGLADQVMVITNDQILWDPLDLKQALGDKIFVFDTITMLVDAVLKQVKASDHILVMSNGSFDGIHNKILEGLHEPS